MRAVTPVALFLLSPFIFGFVSAAPGSSRLLNASYHDEASHILEKYSDKATCGGLTFKVRGGSGADDPTNYGKWCKEGNTPLAYTYDLTKGVTTAESNIEQDSQVHALAGPISDAERKTKNWQCDHIMELQFLATVIGYGDASMKKSPNALCVKLNAETHPNLADGLQKLREIINGKDNVVNFETDIEKIKGDATIKFLKVDQLTRKVDATNARQTVKRRTTDLEWMALNDYLTKTASRSTKIAEALDRSIEESFGKEVDIGVEALWKKYREDVARIASTAKTNAEAAKKAAEEKCEEEAKKDTEKRSLFAHLADFGDALLRRTGVKTKPKTPPMSCPLPKGKTPTKPPVKPKTPTKPPVKPKPKTPTKPKPKPKTPTKPVKPKPKAPVKAKPKTKAPVKPKPKPRPAVRSYLQPTGRIVLTQSARACSRARRQRSRVPRPRESVLVASRSSKL
ncbi:hypothetical protein EXIGLDRAFT_726291 [Exidia glandulosa HHB12029]|uniref:Uncharacterized protein n=1 Tax=Exidia glandulosa HHB12029 TaxID=1314781 RepID=A0A165DTP8_EXIGL|nr:hypothetical protein EXIGLDRAFT_726291 [Exidia glandulosa HHB12029]